MQRRDFLKTGLAAGTATFVGGCSTPQSDRSENSAQTGANWSPPEFEHGEATIIKLQRAQTEGRLTARALAEAYFSRMDEVDAAGPRLASVIERNPEALALAEELDRERKESGARGPLHGIPVLIKDNIATADRMETTAGSMALIGSKPPMDAALVARLREAGAVILGKTNLSEWANFRSTRSTSGWSGRGGQTLNPFAINRSPCGSSSGSATAASANLCAAAIGTETDGSVVCPASMCGLVGIKPTVGLVSRSGIIPVSATQDTAGPMARTVSDAALLLTAIAGMDEQDPATRRIEERGSTDYTAFLDADALKSARLGVARNLFGRNERVKQVIEEAISAMRKLGAEAIDPVEIQKNSYLEDAELQVLLYEFKAGLNQYLATLGPAARCKTLSDLISYNNENRGFEMPYFEQEIFLMAQEKDSLAAKEYLDSLEICRRLSTVEGIDAAMDKYRLDALVAPTTGPAFLIDLINGDHYTGIGCSTLPAVAGYPHITVPAGNVFGLPIGVSFFGRAWSEPRLIGLAYAFEQATKARFAPQFLATADLAV